MMTSITQAVDSALKTLLYTKFADILGISTGSGSTADKINKGVVQIPNDVALRIVSEKRGSDFLEFINFWRMGTSPSWDRQRTPLARRGMYLSTNSAKTSTVQVKAQPVDLNYNSWFWSKKLDKVYQCIERYILWQQSYPKIDLTYVFDNDNSFEYSPDLHFGEIVDESTVSEQFEKGICYIYKMPIKIDAWVLDGFSFKTITKILLKVYDKDEVTNYSEIVVEDSNQDTELEDALRMFSRALYAIKSINLGGNYVVTPRDRSVDFAINDKLIIENSTANDGIYTVSSVSVVSGETRIVLTEALVDDTANGNIYKVN